MPSLLTIIEEHLRKGKNKRFYFLEQGEKQTSKTHAEIVVEAKKLASWLVDHFETQSRIILVYPPGLDFISGFLACLYAKMIAVPTYPLRNPRQANRLRAMMDSCEPSVILGTQQVIDDLAGINSLSSIEKIAVESLSLPSEHRQEIITHEVSGSTIAFLQYTSGSTGDPKGVMVSHDNLISNLLSINKLWGLGEDKTTVFWLPFQHDLGLIGGVLASLYNYNELVLLPPAAVIQKPYRWLKALTDFKAYFTASPNFAYQLCVNKISIEDLQTLDLSTVGYALAAAEPNRYKTVEAFCSKFSICGFKKEAYGVAYGLAENTLVATASLPGHQAHFMNLSRAHLAHGQVVTASDDEDQYLIMSAGNIFSEHEIAIVNPDSKVRCGANEVGEIWIHGSSVALGYWSNSKATKQCFNVFIQGDKKPYLRTGDLGFISDNELYVTGRQKDLMIIEGRNIYPQDLEAVAETCHEFIKPGCSATFSIDTGKQEEIVICVEIKRTAMDEHLSEIIPTIRQAIAKQYEVAIHDIKLLKPNGSFKTTSGKIQRKATKKAYLENKLECIHLEPNALLEQNKVSKLAMDIHKILVEVLGVDRVELDQRFSELGGKSIDATLIYQKLQAYFGPQLIVSPTVAFDYPTLAELIEFATQATTSSSPIESTQVKSNENEGQIAIIGIGCRLPGKVNNMDDLWALLSQGVDAIEPIPKWRWDIEHYDKEIRDRISQAGILEDIDQFDAAFFNISPKEANQMDPQHRLLLQLAWEALEHAAIAPHCLMKEKIGIYIGSSGSDYKNLIISNNRDANIDSYFVLDNAASVMAGRIAYFFGTQGPAKTIDTACSSSLVALDEAYQALCSGKIKMAIAGGANLILYPENSVGLARADMLSPTSRCHTFSQDADGYVRAEGCALVILKRLDEAINDGDMIHAVIRGTSVNQDGASSGLTVPNLKAQRDLLQDALNQANLTPNEIDYIEAHGSATPLGDPIEFGAINAVFSQQNRTRPLFVGSIKSNIGHLEASAGIAGLLKTIAALTHQELLANIHLQEINRKLDLDITPIEIVKNRTKWHSFGAPRRAGVSSFGFSGTNAHVIVEEAPIRTPNDERIALPEFHLLVLSAKSKRSLEALIEHYIPYLEKGNERLADVCYTAAIGRSHFTHRVAFVVQTKEDLVTQLKAHQFAMQVVPLSEELISSTDLNLMASEYLLGKQIDWASYYTPYLKALRKISVPTYCFDSERYWIGSLDRKDSLGYYIETYEPYTLPEVEQTKKETIVIEVSEKVYAAMPHLGPRVRLNRPEDLKSKHVVFVYEENFNSLLSFAQQVSIHKPLSFTLITEQAFSVTKADEINPRHTQVLGFWKSFRQEVGTLPCYVIDMAKNQDIGIILDLIREGALPEFQLIVRDKIYVPRLMSQKLIERREPFNYRADATYLITGGTGGIGLELAKHLIKNGVRHLALTSRSQTSDDLSEWIKEQQKQGIYIIHYQGDVADKEALRRVMTSIAQSDYPLKGIFHAAGVIQDEGLLHLNEKVITAILSPKVEGSQNLHELSQALSLDCFVLFSSISSLLGNNMGHSCYATANAFMDGLAIKRRQQGLPALSINWGPFAEVGIAASLEDFHRTIGMRSLAPQSAFAAMDSLIQGTVAQIGVMDVDWSIVGEPNNPYLQYVTIEKAQDQGQLYSMLEATPQARREQLLIEHIKMILAERMNISNAHAIDINKGFFDLGMDSITAVELKNLLQANLGTSISLTNTVAFDYPSVKALSDYLLQSLAFKEKSTGSADKPVTTHTEEIAIVGLSGEFPGASNLEEFWDLLLRGEDGVSEVPASRWNINAYYDANPDAPGKMISRRGGFIKEVEQFDADFFSISPKEARYLDPQQRLLLKHAWLALESAGLSSQKLKGSEFGIFVGISTSDYRTLIHDHVPLDEVNAYVGTGNALSTASGRISYVLGVQGPSLALDTACSSSLVALHEALQSLQAGDCSGALVGGVNLLLSAETSIFCSKAGMLSPDGQCKTFDKEANGYVRAEGCGIVVLKRLSDALRDGDRVWAVIKSSGVNQDGASGGLTVPNGQAQERLLRRVLAQSGLSAEDIDCLECHGTGTRLGDPIEVGAIGTVYGQNRGHALNLSSVKSNIGHLEAASGIAGLIKVVLSLHYQKIPKQLHFKQLNPNIPLDFPAEIATETKDWLIGDKPRRAGISSFGFSGTNAHIIVEEAPKEIPKDETLTLPEAHLLVLSAKSKWSLEALVARYIHYLAEGNECLADICYTAAIGRSHLTHRIALVAKNKADLVTQLKAHQFAMLEVPLLEELITSTDLSLMASEYLSGKQIDWANYYSPYLKALRKVSVPTYCFDTKCYWIDIKKTRSMLYGEMVHELLGAKLSGHSKEIHYMNRLDFEALDYLQAHRVYGHVLFPGAGFVESALACGVQVFGEVSFQINDCSFLLPLALSRALEYEVSLEPVEDGRYRGAVYSNSEGGWTHHIDFGLAYVSSPVHEVIDLAALKSSMERIEVGALYQDFNSVGLTYGPAFQSIKEAFVQPGRALVALTQESLTTQGYFLHPALLDGAFQSVCLAAGGVRSTLYIPSSIQCMTWYQKASGRIWVEVSLISEDTQTLSANFKLMDDNGVLLAKIEGFVARAVTAQSLEQLLSRTDQVGRYIEDYDLYEPPKLTLIQNEAMVIVASEDAYAPMSHLGPQVGLNRPQDLENKHVVFVYEANFNTLVALAQQVLIRKPLSFTLITQLAFAVAKTDETNPSHTQVLGFWKSLRQEIGTLLCYLIDRTKNQDIGVILGLIREGALPEFQLIVRDRIYAPRLMNQDTYDQRHPQLQIPEPTFYLASEVGVDTVYWAARDLESLAPDEVRIRILATALNFRDVLKAMNLYPGDAGDFGYEAVGEVLAVGEAIGHLAPGDRVIAVGQGLLAGEAIINEVQTVPLPECLTPAQGASLSIAFLTARYGLHTLARINKGQKVLIHAASGGVGLAAIQWLKLQGAVVYATASTAKQHYLKETLGVKYVYDSRSIDFSRQILADTDGIGVDVVLNSLTGEGFIAASLACLKEDGVFLEMGKINIFTKVQMDEVRPDVCYHTIEIDKRLKEEPIQVQKELDELMSLFAKGSLSPLPITQFPVTETTTALHYLQQAKHIGKIVLNNRTPFIYKADASYLITGGTGGIGLELAKHLIKKGVRHLALTSRSQTSADLSEWIKEQQKQGIYITHYQGDVADKEALRAVIMSIAQSQYPLKGIFHAAGVIHDALLGDLHEEQVTKVLAPKVQGAWHLHELTLNSNLDCFVLFSSVSSLLGSMGQSHYAAANAFMDGLALKRRHQGLPALSINWGPFAGVGMAVGLETVHLSRGMTALNPQSAFVAMDALLQSTVAQIGVMDMDWSIAGESNNPYLKYLTVTKEKNKETLIEKLEKIIDSERLSRIKEFTRELVCTLIGLNPTQSIDEDKDFFAMGFDSLMAVELKNRLQSEVAKGFTLSATVVFEYPTIASMSEMLFQALVKKLNNVPNKEMTYPIEKISGGSQTHFALSPAQKRMWFLYEFDPQATNYNISIPFHLKGDIKLEILQKAFDAIVARHAILRTTYVTSEDGLTQVIHPPHSIAIQEKDWSDLTETEQQKRFSYDNQALQPFDLAKGPMIRMTLIWLSKPNNAILKIEQHHISTDGRSSQMLLKDLSFYYQSFLDSSDKQLPKLPLDYVDYAHWVLMEQKKPDYQKYLHYWQDQLGHASREIHLPLDYPRQQDHPFEPAVVYFKINSEVKQKVIELAQLHGITPFIILSVTYALVLQRYSNDEDLNIGIPHENRPMLELEHIVGLFVNTLVLRYQINSNDSYVNLLKKAAKTSHEAFTNAAAPFEVIVDLLNVERNIAIHPLFQVLFNFLTIESKNSETTHLEIEALAAGEGFPEVDLSLSINESEACYKAQLVYNAKIFKEETIARFVSHFTHLLEEVLKQPEQLIQNFAILVPAEKQTILIDWNNTAKEYPRDKTIHQLFEEQVEKTPNQIALVFENQQMTYRELNEKANQLAHYLVEQGVKAETLVAVICERSLELMVGLFGILKAGGAYVPMDSTHPKERLAYMLEDTKATHVLTQSWLKDSLPKTKAVLLNLDLLNEELSEQPAYNLEPLCHSKNLAYVIYTSGSTGQPKGVMNEHHGVVNYLTARASQFQLNAQDRFILKTPCTFDVSIPELFLPTTLGATLYILGPEKHKDANYLCDFIEINKISIIELVPSTLQALFNEKQFAHCKSLRQVYCGGETLKIQQINEFYMLFDSQLINMYGPTEASVDVSYWFAHPNCQIVPIGKPLNNLQLFILDSTLHPVPIGVIAELYLGGEGLARGYLNRPDLTAERFIDNPFVSDEDRKKNRNTRLYRTGDLCRYLEDGTVEYLGRIDHQVKIRGFRIELGEIESNLLKHPSIQEAVVLAREDEPWNKRLVAYYVAKEDVSIGASMLRDYLKEWLPEYMVPSFYMTLEAIPLTPNGKLDRKALPAPEGTEIRHQFVAPRTPIEEALAEIWQEVLHLDKVGIYDNFFELGGHSLVATQLVARVNRVLNIGLSLQALFQNPSIIGLSHFLEHAEKQTHVPLVAQSKPELIPLSFAQQRLWFLDKLEPNSALYNIPFAFELKGVLNRAALERTFAALIQRHEVLRTSFKEREGVAYQDVAKTSEFSLEFMDLSSIKEEAQRQNELKQRLTEFGARPFNLNQGPLFCALLIGLGQEGHVLGINMHHSISDGWSIGVLAKELHVLYNSASNGLEGVALLNQLPKLAIQYADYSLWQRDTLGETSEVAQSQLRYWKEQLDDAPTLLALPLDYPRPAIESHRGASILFKIPQLLLNQLKALSQAEGTTLFMTLLSSFYVLLHRYTGQEDLVVGSPIAGRNREELEGLIGFFINTLALRGILREGMRFKELLAQVKDLTLSAYENQDVPFERVLDSLNVERSMSHSPLFQVMFVLLNKELPELSLSGLEASAMMMKSTIAKFDLTLNFQETEAGLAGGIEYATDLFKAGTINRFIDHYRQLLEEIVAHPEQSIQHYEIITPAEKQTLLLDWNDTAIDYPRNHTVPELFRRQAEQIPDRTAVQFESHEGLSYRALDNRSNQLAHYLQTQGVKQGTLVGLFVERSVEMLVSALAILKAGGAYVPLDPTYPKDRIAYMISNSKLSFIVSQSKLINALPKHDALVLAIDTESAAISLQSESPLETQLEMESPAYVIYTSGSTGKPKGVVVPHRAVVNFLTSMGRKPGITSSDVLVAVTTLSFDIAVLELFLPIVSGAKTVIASSETVLDGRELLQLLEESGATMMQATPATWRLLILAGWDDPDTLGRAFKILCGGEALQRDLAGQLLKRVDSIWNMYGPTETTVWSTCCEIIDTDSPITIGRPIDNTELYILDDKLRPVGIGIPGELYIGGEGVTLGYLNRPDLTAERFITNPYADSFARKLSPRLYKTGDIARFHNDGHVEYLGRNDNHVKVRGYRIELGEIEANLAKYPAVQQCVAMVREDSLGDVRIVAYVIPKHGALVEFDLVRDHLRQFLPEYMIPQHLVVLDSFPQTQNGKIDRKRLAAPVDENGRAEQFMAPQTDEELQIARIWSELLKTSSIGLSDNFFNLGGHSLLAMQFLTKLHNETGFKLSPRMLVLNNLAQIAEQVAIHGNKNSDLNEKNSKLAKTRTSQIDNEQLRDKPFFFESDGKELFGIYHEAKSQKIQDRAILVCYPIGQEYMRSHFVFQQLANQLAQAGFPVLRFDYHATGDSQGKSSEANLSQWKKDVISAAKRLQELSGKQKISIVGMRFGATLALMAAKEGLEIEDLVLWNPVLNGQNYLDELKTFHKSFLHRADRPPVEENHLEEMIGFAYPPNLQQQIMGVNLMQAEIANVGQTYVISSPGNEQHLADLADPQSAITYHEVADAGNFGIISDANSILLCPLTIQIIIELFTGSGK